MNRINPFVLETRLPRTFVIGCFVYAVALVIGIYGTIHTRYNFAFGALAVMSVVCLFFTLGAMNSRNLESDDLNKRERAHRLARTLFR